MDATEVRAALVAALTGKSLTIPQLVEATGLDLMPVKQQIKTLVARRIVAQKDRGFDRPLFSLAPPCRPPNSRRPSAVAHNNGGRRHGA